MLKRQGYKALITEKDLVLYKIDEEQKKDTIYAVFDPGLSEYYPGFMMILRNEMEFSGISISAIKQSGKDHEHAFFIPGCSAGRFRQM